MGTVSVPLDVSGARPDPTNTPEFVYISGTNFPPSGYAFPQSSSKAIYIPFRALQYGSGNLTLALTWYSRSGSTTGSVTWSAGLAAITPGDATSVEAKAFATATTATTTVNATAKGDTLSTITVSNLDSLANGDDAWIKITRTDTSMVGDAILIGADLAYSDGNSGTAGSGDFVGPASATDTALVRFSSTTGKLGQNSAITCDSSGNLSGVGTINSSTNATKMIAVVVSTADQTLATTTQTAITSLSFSLPAAGTYYFKFVMQTATNTALAAQLFSVSYSGTVTGGIVNTLNSTTASSFATASTTTFTTSGTMTATRTTVTTAFQCEVEGVVTVSTSGTLALNGASGNSSNALVVKARSGAFCIQQ